MSYVDLLNHEDDYEILNEYPFTIKRKRDGYIIGEWIDNEGYIVVKLSGKKHLKHRIIAQHFIPNPDNLPQVDHINHDRTDYHIENLRWVNKSQNQNNQGSYNGVEVNYVDYDDLPDDLMFVDFYNNHKFVDYYYSVETNRFYFDTGINCRELNVNFTEYDSAFVYARDSNNNKTVKIYFTKFKKQHGISI